MATTNLYLFKYNNYLNKILKREETLAGYGAPLVALRKANFNPNDYVATQHIFNSWVMDEKTLPDYCVVCNESDSIISRWFVTSCTRTRGGQWRVQLLADVASDYKEELLGATCFIEKGYTNSSPFVFNNEQMGFNQIKSDEIPLENNLKTPWLVLYLARYKSGAEDETDIKFNSFEGEFADEPATVDTDYTLESLSDYKYFAYSNFYTHPRIYTAYDQDQLIFGAEYMIQGNSSEVFEMTQQFISGSSGFKPKGLTNQAIGSPQSGKTYPTFPSSSGLKGSAQNWSSMAGIFSSANSSSKTGLPVNSYTSNPVGYPMSDLIDVGTVTGYNTLVAENGKTIKVGNTVYRIVVYQNPGDSGTQIYKIDSESGLGQEMKGLFYYENGLSDIPSRTLINLYVHVPLTYGTLEIEFLEIGSASQSAPVSYNFGYTKAITRDASYEIIAAPYRDTTFSIPGDLPGQMISFKHSGDIALQWFQNIINKYNGANFAYDLQLVPYCPVDDADLSTQDIIFCSRGDANLALAIRLQTSSFSQQVTPARFPIRGDLKLSNELDLYRLVSPNGIGEYEWSPAKNGTSISSLPIFEADCTLIPFHPYIKVNPYFRSLYGKDYNDYRGLICGGDFSLPILNSEWETYQLNNKYYQDIFDRTIKHQEFNNKYALIQDIFSAGTGTLSGAGQGALAGGMVGGPLGAVVGGALGSGASVGGGIADIFIGQKIRRENIQYQKDLFGFELGTIKARSESLTRTTSFNQNNKYFPYIEYYTCTEQEKQALLNKIQFNGMTIGVIGTIPDYLDPDGSLTYVQGTIIDIDIASDANVADRLNQVLQGGIRIKNG